jgi:D-glycero-D-manno-heptose 1,7-bisphosphate phosphatase
MAPRKAVFLDRDGTLIVDRNYLSDPDAIEFLPECIEGLTAMQVQGFDLVIVTNQSGVARGIIPWATLHEIHRRVLSHLRKNGVDVRGVFTAPHAANSNHPDRKPNPGLLIRAARIHNLDLRASWMIGDRPSDVEAGERAGTRTLTVGPTLSLLGAARIIEASASN